jgi:hypothetical protein
LFFSSLFFSYNIPLEIKEKEKEKENKELFFNLNK